MGQNVEKACNRFGASAIGYTRVEMRSTMKSKIDRNPRWPAGGTKTTKYERREVFCLLCCVKRRGGRDASARSDFLAPFPLFYRRRPDNLSDVRLSSYHHRHARSSPAFANSSLRSIAPTEKWAPDSRDPAPAASDPLWASLLVESHFSSTPSIRSTSPAASSKLSAVAKSTCGQSRSHCPSGQPNKQAQ